MVARSAAAGNDALRLLNQSRRVQAMLARKPLGLFADREVDPIAPPPLLKDDAARGATPPLPRSHGLLLQHRLWSACVLIPLPG
jgi:hypothetical protein